MPKAKNLHYLTLAVLLPALLLLLLIYNVVPVSATPPKQSNTTEETAQSTTIEIAEWESFLAANPTYIAGWIRLGDLLTEVGNSDYAQGAYATAHAINPNYLGR